MYYNKLFVEFLIGTLLVLYSAVFNSTYLKISEIKYSKECK